MDYKNIGSLTGFSGLFELISSKKDGAVVRSLEDNQTKFVSARIHAMTQIETIEVYTTQGNVNLVEIFKAIKASNEKLTNEKDNYFTVDVDRPHPSVCTK